MVFKGIGVVWNPKAGKPLVNFRYQETYETEDEYEIDILSKANGVVADVEAKPENKPKSRADLLAEAKERGIKGADRMSKSALEEALSE